MTKRHENILGTPLCMKTPSLPLYIKPLAGNERLHATMEAGGAAHGVHGPASNGVLSYNLAGGGTITGGGEGGLPRVARERWSVSVTESPLKNSWAHGTSASGSS